MSELDDAKFSLGLVDKLLFEANPALSFDGDWSPERVGDEGIPTMWRHTSEVDWWVRELVGKNGVAAVRKLFKEFERKKG